MIFPGDVIISEMIRQGLDDMRKSPWILDDVFSSFVTEPALRDKYGQKEIDAAKSWFANNKIEVNLKYRNDKDQFPCVTVAMGASSEKEDMKHLGDLSSYVETLMPNQIGKPIPYVVKPFIPESYDQATGIITIPKSVNIRTVVPGQIFVDPDTGNGYVIQEVVANGVRLEPNLPLTLTRAGIVPQYQIYKVRREHTFFAESYSIGTHVHGDPAALLWLHAIVLYTILRYRESLLEGRGFAQSSVSSTDLAPNSNFEGPGGETVFSRYINLTGQVENSWVKAPQRVIESIDLVDSSDGFKAGIKICSNLDSIASLDTEDDIWVTTDGED